MRWGVVWWVLPSQTKKSVPMCQKTNMNKKPERKKKKKRKRKKKNPTTWSKQKGGGGPPPPPPSLCVLSEGGATAVLLNQTPPSGTWLGGVCVVAGSGYVCVLGVKGVRW